MSTIVLNYEEFDRIISLTDVKTPVGYVNLTCSKKYKTPLHKETDQKEFEMFLRVEDLKNIGRLLISRGE